MNPWLSHFRKLDPTTRVIAVLFYVFALSFAFDFRATSTGSAIGALAQYGFLGIALACSSLIALIGRRHLLAKPGVFLLLFWWGYLAYAFGVAQLNGVEFGRFARTIVPFALCGLAMASAHIAACRGIPLKALVAPVALACTINIVWRVFHGYAFKGVTIETARIEVLSPALNWSFAYIGAALLLRPRIHPTTLAIAFAALGCLFLSVTRALVFPMLASAFMCSICLLLGIRWGIFNWSWFPRKMLPIGGVVALFAGLLVTVSLVQPLMLERWTDRLFNHAAGTTSKDVSWLTREAEAKAMWDILSREPSAFIYGKGVGGIYYWDPSYYPELYLVYPQDFDFSGDFWFAGHSVWTWSLFSGGVIGVLLYIGLFVGVMVLSLRGVWRNRHWPEFSAWIGFLPFVAAWCLLSESATSNPFDERLTGLVFGIMAGLPQALFHRARLIQGATLRQAPPIAPPTDIPPPVSTPIPGFPAL